MHNSNSELPVTVQISGHGPGVLFLHGWNHSRKIWASTISELGGQITSVAIDLPGFGNSPPLPPQKVSLSNFSLLTAQIIQEAAQILDDRNSFLRTIVGDSLGALLILELLQDSSALLDQGQVNTQISLTHPEGDSLKCDEETKPETENSALESVERIVLSGCPSNGLPPHLSSVKNLNIIKNGISTLSTIPTWASKRILRVLSLGTVHRLEDVDDDLVESVLQADPRTSEILFGEIADYSYKSDLLTEPCLNFRVCVVRGEWDRITSEVESRALASQLEGTYCEIPKVGHTPMIESPEAYARVITKKGYFPQKKERH